MTDRPHIVFVDDESDLLDALRRLFRQQNDWYLHFFTSAAQALQLMQAVKVEVLITDLRMPEMDGLQLVQRVNQDYPKTACLMLSGTADMQDAVELINTTRIFRFFSKPCAFKDLRAGITAALQHSEQHHSAPTLELLMQRFELTRAEARLTQSLVLGKALEAAADDIGITVSSARTYLKRVFAKTDCKRQAELVSKVLLATQQP